MSNGWDYPDIHALLAARQQESTLGVNTGGYTMSFGPTLRRQVPGALPDYEMPDEHKKCHGQSAFCTLEDYFLDPFRTR